MRCAGTSRPGCCPHGAIAMSQTVSGIPTDFTRRPDNRRRPPHSGRKTGKAVIAAIGEVVAAARRRPPAGPGASPYPLFLSIADACRGRAASFRRALPFWFAYRSQDNRTARTAYAATDRGADPVARGLPHHLASTQSFALFTLAPPRRREEPGHRANRDGAVGRCRDRAAREHPPEAAERRCHPSAWLRAPRGRAAARPPPRP